MTNDQQTILADARSIKKHPNFGAARTVFSRHYVSFLKANLPLVHMATDEIRFMLGAHILSHHFAGSPIDLSAGITVADIQAFCNTHGLTGRNRISALLTMLRKSGYLRQIKNPRDNRIKRLEATRAGITISKQLISPHLQALTQLQWASHAARRVEIDDAFLGTLARYCSNYFKLNGTLVDLVPEIRLFMAREAGFEILLELISTEMKGAILKDRTVHFHYAAVADRFGVSRIHVYRLIENAAEAGYVTLHCTGGRAIEIHASLFELTDSFIALQLALLRQSMIYAGSKTPLPQDIGLRGDTAGHLQKTTGQIGT